MSISNKLDINIWLTNIDNYYKYNNYKISKKAVIGGNLELNSEFLYVRRLIIDWFNSNKSFVDVKKYQSFKSFFSKYLKSLPQDQLPYNFIIWKDIQLFLKNHGQFLKDVYNDCAEDYKGFSKEFILSVFSIISVNFFYKWRQKRNDSKRSWFSYDNRRKQPSRINMAYFSNIMLKEAEYTRYRSFLNDNSSYVRAY